MASRIRTRIDDLKSTLERLSPRERLMIGGLGLTAVLMVMFIVGYFIVSGLEEIEEENAAIRTALKDLEQYRGCFMEQRQRVAQLESRVSRTPVELNRFVETAASAVGVSIAESSEIAPVPLDRFTQRGVEVRLHKVNIEQLSRLIKELEGSAGIVQITRLNISTRFNQNEGLEVEMVISTFERRGRGGTNGTEGSRRRSRS